MGHTVHHAIVVTGDLEDPIQQAHALAESIFSVVSPLLLSEANGFLSFVIPPDGWNEGGEDSNRGNLRRFLFLTQLKKEPFTVVEEGETLSRISWAEVQYGSRSEEACVSQSDVFFED